MGYMLLRPFNEHVRKNTICLFLCSPLTFRSETVILFSYQTCPQRLQFTFACGPLPVKALTNMYAKNESYFFMHSANGLGLIEGIIGHVSYFLCSPLFSRAKTKGLIANMSAKMQVIFKCSTNSVGLAVMALTNLSAKNENYFFSCVPLIVWSGIKGLSGLVHLNYKLFFMFR